MVKARVHNERRRQRQNQRINYTHYIGTSERRQSNRLRVHWLDRFGRIQTTNLVRALRGQQPGNTRVNSRNSNVAYIPVPGTRLTPGWAFVRHNRREPERINHGLRSGHVNHVHIHPRGMHISAGNCSQQIARQENRFVNNPRQRIGRQRARYDPRMGNSMYNNGVASHVLAEQNEFLKQINQAHRSAVRANTERQRQINLERRQRQKHLKPKPTIKKRGKRDDHNPMNKHKRLRNDRPNNNRFNMRRAIRV